MALWASALLVDRSLARAGVRSAASAVAAATADLQALRRNGHSLRCPCRRSLQSTCWHSRCIDSAAMKQLVAVVCFAACACLSGCGPNTREKPGTGSKLENYSSSAPGAPASVHLVADVSSGDWRMPAGDYGGLRYS